MVLLAVDAHDIFHPLRVAPSDVWTLLDRTVYERPKYVFMSVFKWEQRKGFDMFLHNFWKEFEKEPHVFPLVVTGGQRR